MSKLLSRVAVLALVALAQPAQAGPTGKTWATGCLNEARGTLDRLNLFRSTPKRACSSNSRQVTIVLESPGIAFGKRRATLTEFGSVELIGGPRFAPFTVSVLWDEIDCLIEVSNNAGRMFSPNPNGVEFDTAVIAAPASLTPPGNVEISGPDYFYIQDEPGVLLVQEAVAILAEDSCYGAVTVLRAETFQDFMAQ
jgi:hypothetical protein